MRQIARSLLLCLAMSPVLPLQAEPVQGLFRVVEPLPQGQPEARDEALRRAFDTLVLRLTGKPEAAQSEALAAARKDPQQLVRQFGVQDEQLVVEFDPGPVQRRLQEAGIGTWGVDRPAILAWWLMESGTESQLLGDGQARANALRDAAQHRGLPVVVPLADLGEQLAVTRETLAQPAELDEPSARYKADALLTVVSQEEEGRWQADWQLQLADQQTKGRASGDSLEALADEVMREAHAWLAARYVSRPGSSEAVLLEIDNVDISRYAETERLLQAFKGQLVEANGNRLTYRLEADPAQLRAQLGLTSLQEAPAEPEPVAEPAVDVPVDASVAPQPPQAAPAPVDDGALRLRYRW